MPIPPLSLSNQNKKRLGIYRFYIAIHDGKAFYTFLKEQTNQILANNCYTYPEIVSRLVIKEHDTDLI